MDPRITNLANILVNYSLEIKHGDWVILWGDMDGLPLITEIQRQVLKAGGHLETAFRSDALIEDVLKYGSEEQIRWTPPGLAGAVDRADAAITIRAPSNTRQLAKIDPAKQAFRAEAIGAISRKIIERQRAGSLRWTTTNFPCHALAQEADMSLREYEDFVYHATHADDPDPIRYWENVHKEHLRLLEWLKGKERLEVRGPHVDLSFSVKGRKFLDASGKLNMPDGEIYTSPVEDSVDGRIRYSFPAIHDGRQVDGIELQFEQGRVVQATASKNEAYLNQLLDMDEGARYLGEFAIGTNNNIQQYTGSTLYDEKIGGTIHLAVGFGFEEAGSKNHSSLHWDMVTDMRADSEILVDGELFYKNGEFQV
ncbi:MAG: aminopeptidase [Anaerolineales bacterium]|nr:aminopeptidase [Anaerolineales bacterium]